MKISINFRLKDNEKNAFPSSESNNNNSEDHEEETPLNHFL